MVKTIKPKKYLWQKDIYFEYLVKGTKPLMQKETALSASQYISDGYAENIYASDKGKGLVAISQFKNGQMDNVLFEYVGLNPMRFLL